MRKVVLVRLLWLAIFIYFACAVNAAVQLPTGKELLFAEGHELKARPIVAKKDGPLVYVQDEHNRLHSYTYDPTTDRIYRSKIWLTAFLNDMYFRFFPNYLSLKPGTPWCVSHVQYTPSNSGVFMPNTPSDATYTTRSVFSMISCDPVQILNNDPDNFPWNGHVHPGPLNFVGVNIAANHQMLAISGYRKVDNKPYVAFRPTNMDLCGQNPLIEYTKDENPAFYGNWFFYTKVRFFSNMLGMIISDLYAHYLKLPATLPDWQFVALQEYHGSNISLSQNGNLLSVTCQNGAVDEFDLTLKTWTTSTELQYQLPYTQWPQRLPSPPLCHHKRVRINGVNGTLTRTNQEPIFGIFHPNGGPLDSQIIYKVTERSVWGALRGNEQFFNNKGKIVTLEFL